MLRLSTPNFERFIQADEFDIHYGGGEANVAVSLANYGHAAEYVTAVPDNEIGECAIAALRKYNVGMAHIARCGERLGIYYLEPVLPCVRPRWCMTVLIPQFPQQRSRSLILMPFSLMLTGSILPELLRQSRILRQCLPRKH